VKRQAGFTLIEVLIASVIVMSSIGVLMQLFGAGLERMHRVGGHAHLLMVERQIVDALSQINPALVSQGEGDAEGFHYRWQGKQVSALLPIYNPDTLLPRVAAMYAIDVIIKRPGHADASLTIRRMGWRAMGP